MTVEIELRINGLDVRADSREDEPRLRDIDIAQRAGMPRPRDIRPRIRYLVKIGILNDSDYRERRSRLSNPKGGWQEVTEYWLTETGCMLLLSRLDLPTAIAFTRGMVETLREASRLLREPAAAVRVDASAVHGPLIGDHPEKRELLVELCRAVADKQRCSVCAVHGVLRSRYGVNSVYRISALFWGVVRADLHSANRGERALLPAPKRPRPGREPSSLQTTLFAFGPPRLTSTQN